MKSPVLEKIKARKPFEFNDIFLYSFILLLSVTLFIFCLFSPKTSASGFKAIYDNKTIFELNYSDNSFKINDTYEYEIDVDSLSQKVTIYLNTEKTEFNEFSYDTNTKSVSCTNSTCETKECTLMPPIKDSTGVIYCPPHKLKVIAITNNTTLDLVTGA